MQSQKATIIRPHPQTVEYDDGRSLDHHAVRQITQQWVDGHMRDREVEFTESASARIFCGTWNVNAKKQEGGLEEWLLQDRTVSDVYAVGFQEIVDLNAMNVALDGSKTQQRSQFWQGKIMECLQTTGTRFVLIGEKHLVGLLLCVYAKESVAPFIKDVRVASAGVGFIGMMGNKGGVSVRMNLYDSSICIVCAHLAAHRENVAGRNSDFKNIIERTVLASEAVVAHDGNGVGDDDAAAQVTRPRYGAARSHGLDLSILDHDFVFWIGDLNYRIEDELSTEEIFLKIESKDFASLRALDQLNVERAKGAVFQGFDEGTLLFAPTYKFQPGTDHYERRAEKKLRAPAWCDRVLWRAAMGAVRQLSYCSAALLPSDHKPVSSLLEVSLRKVVAAKEAEVYQELVNTLTFWKSTELPQADVAGLTIDLEHVRFEVPSTASILIRNTGRSILHWHFIPKFEESRLSKRWVHLSRTSGLLLPDEVAEIIVTVRIDKKTAQSINQGRDTLDDVVILRLENSVDHYVCIKAGYERSCYGVLIEELVHTLEPLRSTSLPAVPPFTSHTTSSTAPATAATSALGGKSGSSSSTAPGAGESSTAVVGGAGGATKSPRLGVPKELWRLVDALWTGGALREKDIFVQPGDPQEVTAVREALDCGTDFPPCTPHAIVEALVTFIAALPRPLLPPELCPSSELDEAHLRAWVRRFLEQLPPLNYNAFVYVVSFLREVLAQSEYNRSTPAILATVCVSNMTPSSSDADLTKEECAARAAKQQLLLPVVTYLLTTTAV